jgi:hypothetical protein
MRPAAHLDRTGLLTIEERSKTPAASAWM